MEATTSTCDLVKRENRWIGWRKHSPLRFVLWKRRRISVQSIETKWNQGQEQIKLKAELKTKSPKYWKSKVCLLYFLFIWVLLTFIYFICVTGAVFGTCFFAESHIASMSFIHPTLIQSAYSATIVADQQKWTNSCWFVGERYLWVCCHWNL